jgi:hypothetical protein
LNRLGGTKIAARMLAIDTSNPESFRTGDVAPRFRNEGAIEPELLKLGDHTVVE